MESTSNIVIYSPIEKILFLQGGWMIFLAVLVAAIPAVFVMIQVEKRTFRSHWARKHILWIGAAVFFATLYVMHYGGIKGWW